MNPDRVQIALKAWGLIRGGEPLTGAELMQLAHVTPEEQRAADALWVEDCQASAPREAQQMAQWRYLAIERPGMTVSAAINDLSDDERATYEAITAEDL